MLRGSPRDLSGPPTEDHRLLGPAGSMAAAVARGAVARYSANGDRRRDRAQRPSLELSSDCSSAVTEFSSLNSSGDGGGGANNR